MLFIIVIVLVALYFGGRHARKLSKLEYKRAIRAHKKELHQERMEALDELNGNIEKATEKLDAITEKKREKLEEKHGAEYVRLVEDTNKKTMKWLFIGLISLAVTFFFVPALIVTIFSLFMLIFNGIRYGIKAHKIKKGE
ncbi:hypothetical protein KMD50_gp31 [Lactococcus phage PLgW-1]|uniref:Holin n=3 Tax=Uwajimavirus PLgW1 TaxID=2845441 RepID=A0A2Z2NZY2_9CAUD|nr:hypothetical protein KMD50_gp31 [Lactococcus phage PLgW-1]ARQ94842.1 hypothetical protein PLgW1_31 [Lactococcus phage PLgW-1]ASJ80014.1 hypothetical protein [Lactococcus phage PLgY-16]ASJ80069.1 hypothetical protein [Lactococcus phage PLgY-30]